MVNINVGVLGHVDSGKTSLCRALSQQSSTAAFDKHPQARERGITIDLGFSTFSHAGPDGEDLQFTLVDCPGHASLIRTVIGGAQIIDIMLLVIDVTKGIQTQTAECLVIGEICCDKMIVVLNKIDLLEKKQKDIESIRAKIGKTLQRTKFKDSPMVALSASDTDAVGIEELKRMLSINIGKPIRHSDGPFVCFVDHCFQIKGQGTILTGTIVQGRVTTNMAIEIPTLKVQRKVKSMQVFRRPVTEANQGDRVGICVVQLDAKSFERGVVCTPGHLRPVYAIIMPVNKIPFYKHEIRSGSKLHITAMHDTVLGKITLFSSELEEASLEAEFVFEESVNYDESRKSLFALVEFEQPMISGPGQLHLASKLDMDINTKSCRLAFHGRACRVFDQQDFRTELSSLKVYKTKHREGLVDRMPNDGEVIVKNLFKKETNIDVFQGMKVEFSSGDRGTIQGSFGQSGKVKVQLDFQPEVSQELLKYRAKKIEGDPVKVSLTFKRYIFDGGKRMVQ